MSTSERMNIDERLKYLRVVKPRYAEASRSERSKLLDEMEAVTGLNRKVLIRRMNGDLERKRRARVEGARTELMWMMPCV